MGWEKVACWSTKAAISLKLVKIGLEEKLLWRAYRKSPTLFRTVPYRVPTPYGLFFPQDWGSQPPPKTSRTGKATDFNLAGTFTGYIGTKAH